MKRLFYITVICAACLSMSVSCGSLKHTAPTVKVNEINLALIRQPQSNKYIGMDYGIKLNVSDKRADKRTLKKYDSNVISIPLTHTYPEVESFVDESMRRYMRTMGFNLDADVATDYMMSLTIDEFHVNWLSGTGWSATVRMMVTVYDSDRTAVYPGVRVTGRASRSVSPTDFAAASATLNEAYANALEDIDWDRIAFFLKKASTPALEGNKQVAGNGSTALESTVIRWYVESRPQGADVSWRVVSSTPEVKNTNQTFLGSTPYESTETFDIKGLTYNNSGNVQIEVTCEKSGYITQRRRFNLRQAIDQKEISTKFNLVAEDD